MVPTETLTLKLPESLAKALLRASQREQISKSELVRRVIAAHLGRSQRDVGALPSLLDRADDLVGCFDGGPKDLASNPRHLAGFGKV
jgi:Ribbon-helix-helix protein, copG family